MLGVCMLTCWPAIAPHSAVPPSRAVTHGSLPVVQATAPLALSGDRVCVRVCHIALPAVKDCKGKGEGQGRRKRGTDRQREGPIAALIRLHIRLQCI